MTGVIESLSEEEVCLEDQGCFSFEEDTQVDGSLEEGDSATMKRESGEDGVVIALMPLESESGVATSGPIASLSDQEICLEGQDCYRLGPDSDVEQGLEEGDMVTVRREPGANGKVISVELIEGPE
ncbi:MAG: hypothetical protein ACREQV_14310 [Candidatus Binatia bacterium]